MRYRIAETTAGFKVQRSVFGLLWFDYRMKVFSYDLPGCWEKVGSTVHFFDSLDKAKNDIQFCIKNYPIWYKGHKIIRGVANTRKEEFVYIDASSYCSGAYRLGSFKLFDLMSAIDNVESMREREKEKKKILSVTKVY